LRFTTYTADGEEGVALKSEGGYRGLPVTELGGDLRSFLHDDSRLARLAETLAGAPESALSDVRLLPPVPRPEKILCIGLNHRAHSAESGFEVPTYPAVFARFADSLVAHGEPLVRPHASDLLDYANSPSSSERAAGM
jgi:2-keto-4-pentenoate hydratase/2-oxohepta-3-ene-1,7-dioic acid hydratase in catechol pathway